MNIEDYSEDIVLVELSGESKLSNQLKTVLAMVRDRDDCNIVIDFSNIDDIDTDSLYSLLVLNKCLERSSESRKREYQLVLCNISPPTKDFFMVTSLDGHLKFVDDKDAAIAKIRNT